VENSGLFWRKHEGGNWSDATCIKKYGVTKFTISLSSEQVLILCQNVSYVKKIIFDGGVISISTLVSGTLNGQYYGINTGEDNGMHLLHNILVQEEQSQILMSHNVSPQGLWSNSKHLGRIIPFDTYTPYWVVPIHGQHYLVFYQEANTTGFGVDLGYREIYGSSDMGDFKTIHPSSNLNSRNFSFLANTNGVHMVYKIKNIMNSSLVYQKLDEGGLSSKMIVAQGQAVHSPIVYIENNQVNIAFMRGFDIFSCKVSGGKQVEVSQPQKHNETISQNIMVSKFLQENEGKNRFASNEIYTDSNKPWDVKFFSQIYSDITGQKNHSLQNITPPQSPMVGKQEEYDSFFEVFEAEDFHTK